MMPVFMIGTQRSGSNLLRLMLNQLPEIAAPHPPHILQRFMPLVPAYGDLSVDANFSQLVDDVCRLVELNPVPWTGVVLDRADIARRCPARDLLAVQAAIYQVYTEKKGAKTWCCKSLANINYAPEIETYFRKPRYIYLYRDGRDVAVSFSKAVVGDKHFYHIARDWAATQRQALALRRGVEPERFISVRYEDLISAPELTTRALCCFLGVAFRDSMLDYYGSDEARRAASSSDLWRNVVNPVNGNNSRKFLREASERDVRVFESVAGPVLDELGYDRVYVKSGEEQTFTLRDIAAYMEENARLKQEVRNRVDPGDLSRRDQQAHHVDTVRQRLDGHTTARNCGLRIADFGLKHIQRS